MMILVNEDMSMQYYILPQNTSGAEDIPITNTPTPLASLTYTPASGNDITGNLIYSTLDTGEGNYDFRKVTALAHVDRGFTTSGPVTYTLTAELTNPGTEASAIGPLTFMAIPEN
ncbi:MAG: hypothetical protein GX024_05025 [Clostridiales bacterium]|nr:hypothetical protein [Clostridiales bacterium]